MSLNNKIKRILLARVFVWYFFVSMFVFVSMSVCVNNAYAQSQTFTGDALTRLKQQYSGKQWLLLLWSVDCPPCYKELAVISKLRGQNKKLAVVIVNADDNDEVASERQAVLKRFNLDDLTTFHFSDGQAAHARYVIDPLWYGELPRSYFVDAKGKKRGKSGLLSQALLEKWLLAP